MDRNKDDNRIKSPVPPGKTAKVPVIMQMEALECGAACLDMVLAYYGRFVSLSQLRKECGVSRDGSSLSALIAVAESYGLKTSAFRMTTEELKTYAFCPAILFWENNHFVVLCGYKNGKFTLNDPAVGVVKMTEEQFSEGYSGICALLEPGDSFEKGGSRGSVMGFLKKSLSGAFPMVVLVIITSLILTVCGLIEPALSRFFLDYMVTDKASSAWSKVFFSAFVVVAAIEVLTLWIRSAYLVKMQGKMSIYNSTRFIWHVLSLPMDFFSQRYPGDIINRHFYNESIANLLVIKYAPLVLNFLAMFFYLIMMAVYSPALTVVGLCSVALNIVVTIVIKNRIANAMRLQIKNEAELANTGVNGIQMIETIKSSGAEYGYFTKWAGQYADYNNGTADMERTSLGLGQLPRLITALTSGLILCVGVGSVIKGNWTIGIVSAFAAYLDRFTAPSQTIISSLSDFTVLNTQIESLKDVMEYDSGEQAGDSFGKDEVYRKLEGGIELKNVTFGYNKFREPPIKDFSLTIEKGQSIAIVGRSGSGKSTLAGLITNLCTPWEGEILFDGRKIGEIDRNSFIASVSSVDQHISMFPDTIYNNITMWDKSIAEEAVTEAAKDAGIYDDIMNCENGFDTMMKEGGKNFSGGQRQRIEIARALATEPTILIMDEATSALDAETEEQVTKNIRQKGLTTVLISHRLSAVRDCDRIIVLKDGKILDQGTHGELIERCGYYAEIVTNE